MDVGDCFLMILCTNTKGEEGRNKFILHGAWPYLHGRGFEERGQNRQAGLMHCSRGSGEVGQAVAVYHQEALLLL